MTKNRCVKRRVVMVLAGGLALLPFKGQSAATVLLWPIDPWLSADRNATELWIENQGTNVTTMQVRIVRWQQKEGFERYEQQQDVVASPPILRIERDSKQLIRLIQQTAVPAGNEQAYRIIVDEIPQPEAGATSQTGLKLQMRYSIPLFVYGKGVSIEPDGSPRALVDPRSLSWRVVTDSDIPTIEMTNRGKIHIRLSEVSVRQGGLRREMAPGLLGYVLPGESRRWPLPAGVNQPSEMTATINARNAKWQSVAEK